jgi:hypothetical protein
LDLRPCAAVEVGRLSADGADLPDAQRSARPWVSLAPLARARLRPGLGALFFELEAALPLNLVRDRFLVDPPSATLYRAPSFGGSGAAGVGWEMW